MARRGAQVAIADLHDERAAGVRAEIEALGRSAQAVRCDVRRDADVDALHAAVSARFGRCDLLVNSAGVAMLGPAEAFSMQDWQWILDVNLLGVIRVCRRFLPDLIAQKSGYIANVAPVAGLFAYIHTHPELEAHIRARRNDLDAAIAAQVRELPDPFAGR